VNWLSDFRDDVRREADYGVSPPGSLVKSQGLWALLQYRVAHQYGDVPWVRPGLFVWKKAVESLTGISIDREAEIGPGCYIGHFGGIIIGGGVVMGARCNISQGVTIGVHKGGSPTIGRECGIAAGAVVIGPITVGDNAYIGANAVVSRDIPAGSMVRSAPISVSTDEDPTS
jgi:serine O-acetyltransferase